ncbi:NHL repeat-containing protein [Desulfuromonas sp. AOP6]|uniref:NHL repeat-containing protein n=1 Tax=Desulfuromonas sp. AOP6 TaxID=1566351 RepID=UPI0012861CA7|nr:NHL repeat-containing protein [Desulfuromonas sp. AOP6]BCA79883.1 hypothetical protein AOP6_1670 [Desulfuromonas sp. AOP6]
MKPARIVILTLMLFLLPLVASAASTVKLKYIQTLYTDAEGKPMNGPSSVAVKEDAIVVADSDNRRLLRFTLKDGVVTPGATISVDRMYPVKVQIGSNGELFVLDGKDRRIVRLGADGALKGNLDIKGLASGKVVPRSLRITQDGRIVILDIFSERVLWLDSAGTVQEQIPFPEDYGFISDLSVDRQGNVFLIDSVTAVVYLAKKGEDSFVPLTGSLKEHMNFPSTLEADNQGHVYLVDQYGSGLAVIGMDGSFLGRKLGMGWNDSQLFYPEGISISDTGDVFIADRENNRVQQFLVVE